SAPVPAVGAGDGRRNDLSGSARQLPHDLFGRAAMPLERGEKSTEGVGFEPTSALRRQQFSRLPRSTTPAPLQDDREAIDSRVVARPRARSREPRPREPAPAV